MVSWIAILPIATLAASPAQDGAALYAKVFKKLGASKTLTGSLDVVGPVTQTFTFAFMKPNYGKFEGTLQAHYSDGKSLWLTDFFEDPLLYGQYPAQKSGHKQGLVPGFTFGLEAFTVPEGRGFKFGPQASATFEGKNCTSFRMYLELDPDNDVTLFVDPKSDLPLGWAGNTSTNKRRVVYRNLRLGAPLKAADFAWTPPDDAQDRHSKQAKQTLHDKMLPEKSVPPPIELTDISGAKLSLEEEAKTHKGVLLHLWSFSCVSCRQELKKLEALARKNPEVLVVSLTDDIDAEALRQYVKEGGFTFRFATLGLGMGKGMAPLWTAYKVQGKMSSYLIGPDGKIEQRIPNLEKGWEKLKLNLAFMKIRK